MNRRDLRRLLAVAFLFVFFAEWGSHSLAFAHSCSSEGRPSAHAEHAEHEDLCKTLIRCSDAPGKDQLVPNFGHDLVPQSVFRDGLQNVDRQFYLRKDPRLRHPLISGLARPSNPPFHPPELS